MKKLLTIFALVAILVTTTSGNSEEQPRATIGDNAPDFVSSSQNGEFRLSELQGRYVLLSFWTSSDAESRRLCKVYDNFATQDKSGRIASVGINFDSQSELFEQIVRQDRLKAQTQYNVNGKVADHIRRSYGLTGRLGTLLIDPEGRIVAVNPSFDTLNQLSAA